MIGEKLDNKGLRLFCTNCNTKLRRQAHWTKQATCAKCGKIIRLNPMDDIPYKDTTVSIGKSQEDIIELLESIGLRESAWTTVRIDNMRGYRLTAKFDDGSEFYKEFPIPATDNDRYNRQIMRIFYHFIKAWVTNYKMGIMSKAEAMLGLLKVGNSNLGKQIEDGDVNLLGKLQQNLLEGNQ